MKKYIILFFSIIFLSGCSITTEWSGFYYPDKNDREASWKIKHGFKSIEECREWVKSEAGYSDYDYECGTNCEVDKYGNYSCDKKIK